MPQSYTSLHYHLVFSTRHREPLITPVVKKRLHAYMGGIIKAQGGHPVTIGVMADHVHLLVRLGPTKALADILRVLKANSTGWMKETFPELSGFAWQSGYGAFTVSITSLDAVRRYIENQEEHHRKRSFQSEYRAFLKRHDLEFDERYLWD
jgi:REP element-mobilizing transposase RayT